MKKILLPFAVISAIMFNFTGCLTSSQNGQGYYATMYNWGNYTATTCEYIKNGDTSDESTETLLAMYQEILTTQTETFRQTIPPGVCADYGYFLVKAGRIEEGKELLLKEKELYPESGKFIDSILKRIEG